MNKYFKNILIAALMMLATTVMAGANDFMLAFSTKGPDVYADGSSVQVGECYALVWVRDGFEFKGIDMNGRAVDTNNSAVVAALPLAKAKKSGGVHCPLTLFQIDEAFAAAHNDGSYALVLLDTRKANNFGELVASGNAKQVNGWGFTAKSRVKALNKGISAGSLSNGEKPVVSAQSSAIPADETIPQPKITGISVRDGYVTLTVKGTSPRLLYNIASGSTPSRRDNARAAVRPVQGHANGADREIKVVMPVTKGQNFFRIVRN